MVVMRFCLNASDIAAVPALRHSKHSRELQILQQTQENFSTVRKEIRTNSQDIDCQLQECHDQNQSVFALPLQEVDNSHAHAEPSQTTKSHHTGHEFN